MPEGGWAGGQRLGGDSFFINLPFLWNTSPFNIVNSTSYGAFNSLTTNDNYSRYRNSAACYQLAQSILKIGSALAERVG